MRDEVRKAIAMSKDKLQRNIEAGERMMRGSLHKEHIASRIRKMLQERYDFDERTPQDQVFAAYLDCIVVVASEEIARVCKEAKKLTQTLDKIIDASMECDGQLLRLTVSPSLFKEWFNTLRIAMFSKTDLVGDVRSFVYRGVEISCEEPAKAPKPEEPEEPAATGKKVRILNAYATEVEARRVFERACARVADNPNITIWRTKRVLDFADGRDVYYRAVPDMEAAHKLAGMTFNEVNYYGDVPKDARAYLLFLKRWSEDES